LESEVPTSLSRDNGDKKKKKKKEDDLVVSASKE